MVTFISVNHRKGINSPSEYFTLAQKPEKKIKFELEKISSWLELNFFPQYETNLIFQTLENGKVQIYMGFGFTILQLPSISIVFHSLQPAVCMF